MFLQRIFFVVILLLSACADKPSKLFVQLPPAHTGVFFNNEVVETDTVNVLDYFYIYNGAGVALGDVNNDGLDDVFFVGNNRGRNILYINQGKLKFEDVTAKAGVSGKSDWSTGVTMVDINADGWLDIYVCTVNIPGIFKSRNELYINQQDGTFSEEAVDYGLGFSAHSTQASFFDYDKDGLLDCFVLNHSTELAQSFRVAGNRNIIDTLSGDRMYHAQQVKLDDKKSIKYRLVSPQGNYYSSPISFGLGLGVGDLNNDGWLDIYATNDFREQDYCYINQQNGKFLEKGSYLFGHHSRFSMGCDIADYNNDGRLDIVSLDMLPQDEKALKSSMGDEFSDVYDYKRSFGFFNQYSRNCLQTNLVNTDSMFFGDLGLQAGIEATDWSWAPLLADFDNDGYKDLFISNGYLYRANDLDFMRFKSYEVLQTKVQPGKTKFLDLLSEMPSGKVRDYFFKGTGSAKFVDKSVDWGLTDEDLSHGAAYSDLDNDGDLDLVVNRMNQVAAIYENRSNPAQSNFLTVKLNGEGKNLNGIGATVYAYSTGDFQMLQQMPTRGFMSSVSSTLHFGLGKRPVDSLVVIWPSGYGQRLKNVQANSVVELREKDAIQKIALIEKKKPNQFKVADVTKNNLINVKHEQAEFNDFTNNPFIPHKISTQGNKIAVGDVNADGVDDYFVTKEIFDGKDGSSLFKTKDQSVDAIFVDVDNDSDLDLVTVSGGNQFYGIDDRLRDHLYINDNGSFFEAKDFPALYENKSCVRACDFDRDGDIDLFIGGRANARMYGMVPTSSLLLNDGKGHFTLAFENLAPELSNVGMITDAIWQDIDGDSWPDLIVVGEFMPITFFKNHKGKQLQKNQLVGEASRGFWTCIRSFDVDDDGDQDFLIGNWGSNSKLRASAKWPVKLFMFDYDNNGDYDPLLCIAKDGEYYPFLGKEDLEKRLPILKKKFLKYRDMAGKTAREIFGNKLDGARVLQADNLNSSILLNEKGEFRLLSLSSELQTAPIFSFQQIEPGYFFAAGNFYGTQPFEGRYDALPVTIFGLSIEKQKAVCTYLQYVFLPGEVMDSKPYKAENGERSFLFAVNDHPLRALKIQRAN